jgi:hypothetical protein
MARWLLTATLLAGLVAPACALTEQEIIDRFGDDLVQVVVPLHRAIPIQQLNLTASLDLAGDRAQLDMSLALRALAADLGLASTRLAEADKDTAPTARQQYLIDLTQAVSKYQQAVAQAHNSWNTASAQAHQASQQGGATGLQTAFQALAVAQQRAMQQMAGSTWTPGAPVAAPTLPDLTGPVNFDAERLAEAAFVIGEARRTYLADVNALLATADEDLEGTIAGQQELDGMPEAASTLLRDLSQATCQRYVQYESEVRQVLSALCQTCDTP